MWRVMLSALVFVSVAMGVLVACANAVQSGPIVRVALRADVARTNSPVSYLAPGDTIALVARSQDASPVTLAAVSATDAVAGFRRALAERRLPATSPIVEIPLPAQPSTRSSTGLEFDIFFFADRNRNQVWDDGEPFVTSWTGGRGGYRVAHLFEVPSGARDAVAGWNLLEGGVPPVYHSPPNRTLVYMYALIEPIERR